MTNRVLLIGWDAADWKVMSPLMEAGQMPCTSRLVERGVMGNLATLKPVLSPMLWNSIGTGKRADKHGILGFTEVNPHTGQVGPSLSTSRKVKALWNIASQSGRKAHVVNWFASHPAEAINGVCVSETYSTPPKSGTLPWPLAADAIHPASLRETLADLRILPQDLTGAELQMFCPLASRVDQATDRRIHALACQIAEAVNVQTAATYILEHESWDFVAVYFGAIDHFCHLFMHYHPPKRPDISVEDFEIYQDVVNNCYRFHDVLLARLLELAGDDVNVIICSDHGFRSDHLRPPHTPLIPAGPAYWHRDQGVLMMAGPSIKSDELVHGATLLDIAPTVLALMDLPVARDMDGRVLIEATNLDRSIKYIDSWEDRSGPCADGMHSDAKRMSAEDSQAILEQFVALGYIDPLDEDKDRAAITAHREAKWNLATSHIDAGQIEQAIPLLAEIVEEFPDRKDIVITLANCLRGVGMISEAEQLILLVLEHDVEDAAIYHTLAEIELAKGNAQKAIELLEQLSVIEDKKHTDFSDFYSLGRAATLGATYLKLKMWAHAVERFQDCLRLDPDHVRAMHGATQALLKLRKYELALDYALRAVELEYRSPLGHYLLGIAFARAKYWERAAEAFLVALRFNPSHLGAYRMLAVVYGQLPGLQRERSECQQAIGSLIVARGKVSQSSPASIQLKERIATLAGQLKQFYARAAEEKRNEKQAGETDERTPSTIAEENTQPVVKRLSDKEFLIVSGLPRSGTSLMMQMLHAGGFPVMTDHQREADIDNPDGYFEWELIKKIKSRPEIIEEAEGKATKVISMLLPYLPKHHRYKVIFMMRPIDEVVASQQKMISRRQTEGAALAQEDLKRSLEQHRIAILQQLHLLSANVFVVKYEQLISRTENVVEKLQEFLGADILLDQDAMRAKVRPELWRNRS